MELSLYSFALFVAVIAAVIAAVMTINIVGRSVMKCENVDKFTQETQEPVKVDINPQQKQLVGLLSSADHGDATIVLPLFGAKLENCERWQYFTVIKNYIIPVTYENKDCYTSVVGCTKITTGARVTVPEYAGKVFVFRSL